MPVRADPGTSPSLAVVIPAFQAAGTIAQVWDRVRKTVPHAGVWVVDDGSTDGTGAQVPADCVLRHPANRGKGAALRTGIARALETDAEWIVTLDADGQHPPEE